MIGNGTAVIQSTKLNNEHQHEIWLLKILNLFVNDAFLCKCPYFMCLKACLS